MTNVEARIKVKGKHYEIYVDLEEALKVKAGKGDILSALQSPNIFYDLKKGTAASQSDLMDAFGTNDVNTIAKKIIISGEVQKTQDFRDSEREAKIKQVLTLILKNAVDQHGRPFTEQRLRAAVDQVHFSFDNRAAEQQMNDLIDKLRSIIPIKIETKRIKLIIPATYTGRLYGMLQDYKETEEWMPNGNLKVILNVPAGLLIDFYDKMNGVTHGSVQSEEMSKE